ncbi:SpaA isopeptide-forming pilin-related protein [Bifidobacterium simiarum]|uniref:SpaA isopeptide-forming pilin-related protein n=1 Tax=Bifidobacterium simiarum TaxID=2045441 RepID=UPI001BDD20D8|nr:SpaA isopeptide-forming pilin-related protein [Bifidobacterium simiarum]MBT1165525.1 hypothetical protein [Bifidobacterium simiarum]
MKMRKLFAGLAAAATLLSGLAFGAATASADDTTRLPYEPLANGQVDTTNGKVTANATFKFTADNANQWGKDNNRVIKAYKLADYYQYVDANGKAVFGVQTVDDAKNVVKTDLGTALDGITANTDDPYAGKVPSDADPLAWALQYGYLDQSANKPWENKDGANTASTTRKFANALSKDANLDNLNPTELSVANKNLTVDTSGTFAKADLSAGIYLFLDVTKSDANGAGTATNKDKNWIQNGKENDGTTFGEVVVNSAPIILASGNVTDNYLYPLGDLAKGDNTVAFKNHVTPVTKTVDDSDKTVSTGQTVRYTLSSTLPLTTGYDPKTYVYQLTDYPGTGQTVNLDGFAEANAEGGANNAGAYDVKVYDGDKLVKTLVAGTDFDLTTSAANNGKEIVGAADNAAHFTLDFGKLIQSADYNTTPLWGKTVKVTYAAKITGVRGDVPNTVEVNDNHAKAQHGTRLTLGGFQFTKTDAQGNALQGAEFTITAVAADTNGKTDGVIPTDKVAISTDQGVVAFSGLADGVYEVTETKVPTGFLQGTTVKFKVTISKGAATSFDGTDIYGLAPDLDNPTTDADYKVKNVRNITELPKTGAAGIAMFLVLAAVLGGAGAVVYTQSRRTRRALHA